ncbi:hypothetical protein LCGC14_0721520 [marine sediment metagenome]|uniref:Uncharacterized protein n=1 Tax=marine sediment metagenome TaxID=412755 RepID=A0A0F9QGF9_9ZZZZ
MSEEQSALIESEWTVEHWRDGKMIDKTVDRNIVTDEGLNQLLRIMFIDGTQIAEANWFVLIFKTDTTPAAGTTYGTPVFTEETDYDSATRPIWDGGAVSSESVDNSAAKATFVFDATSDGNTIYGAAMVGGVGAGVKGNTADTDGRMYAAAKFGASKAIEDNDTLKVTITLTAADA